MRTGVRSSNLINEWGAPLVAPLADAVAHIRREGGTFIDLATASLGTHRIRFPADRLARASIRPELLASDYNPDPLGAPRLRETISSYLLEKKQRAAPGRILITPGTSLLYFYTFRILAERGAEVLVPSPGYPLFDDLATAAGVHPRRYYLREEGDGWIIDPGEIEFQITPRTRAICIVAPHNPLGISPSPDQWHAIATIARRHQLPILVDEVFSTYYPSSSTPPSQPMGDFPLLLRMDGLSKSLFLPGLKISWMTVDGDTARTTPFLHAMERLADAFLPVSDAAVSIACDILPGSTTVLEQFRREMDELRETAAVELGDLGKPPSAGVYIPLKLPDGRDPATLAMKLLVQHGVLVHPGDYHELPEHLVMTWLSDPERLRVGCQKIRALLHQNS